MLEISTIHINYGIFILAIVCFNFVLLKLCNDLVLNELDEVIKILKIFGEGKYF